MAYTRFTQEQLEQANQVDLAELLRRQGEKLRKEGIVQRWLRYDSTVIYGNKWYRHSKEIGGGPIQFMKEFYDMEFADAVQYLLGGQGGLSFAPSKGKEYIKPELHPPAFSKNMRRTFAYLIKTRNLDPEIVQYFVREKKILETEPYHNVAFAGYDSEGKLRQLHLRSTQPGNKFYQDVDGSDKHFYFRHIGTDNSVYVFEAPIDMLSFITMHKENWQQHSYACLGGVAIDALENVLETAPQTNQVYLCLDNDKAGDTATERISKELDEKCVPWQRLCPDQKDWNEDLQQQDCCNENFFEISL